MKLRLQKKAQRIIKSADGLKIIAIAGSYGKTTTKNFIYELLKYNYRVQMVPGNINTPTGIAAWVLREFKQNTEILLVEMDGYFIGEVRQSCEVAQPDFSVITAIGDQHVERFGSRQKMERSILEVFTAAKSGARLIMFESEYKKLDKKHISITGKIQKVNLPQKRVDTNIVSETAYRDLILALSVCASFNIPKEIVRDTLTSLTLPDRRQKPVVMHGYETVDDSYNISFTTGTNGVLEAKKLAVKKHKKLIVITAGIPELGPNDLDANIRYGEFLKKEADTVIVLNSIFAKEINSKNIFKTVNNLGEAWVEISSKYNPKNYLALMQPELTDLYYN